jgi:hypothetical protein
MRRTRLEIDCLAYLFALRQAWRFADHPDRPVLTELLLAKLPHAHDDELEELVAQFLKLGPHEFVAPLYSALVQSRSFTRDLILFKALAALGNRASLALLQDRISQSAKTDERYGYWHTCGYIEALAAYGPEASQILEELIGAERSELQRTASKTLQKIGVEPLAAERRAQYFIDTGQLDRLGREIPVALVFLVMGQGRLGSGGVSTVLAAIMKNGDALSIQAVADLFWKGPGWRDDVNRAMVRHGTADVFDALSLQLPHLDESEVVSSQNRLRSILLETPQAASVASLRALSAMPVIKSRGYRGFTQIDPYRPDDSWGRSWVEDVDIDNSELASMAKEELSRRESA